MEERDCNALILPAHNKKKRKANKDHEVKAPLSKNEQRKLRRLQEEKEKKEKVAEVLETLEKHKLAGDAYALLYASGTRGQRESMREKLRRAIHYKRAGLKVPAEVPLLRERDIGQAFGDAQHASREEHASEKALTMDETGVSPEGLKILFSDNVNAVTKGTEDADLIQDKNTGTKSHKELDDCDTIDLEVKRFTLKQKKRGKKRKQAIEPVNMGLQEDKVPSCGVEDLIATNCDSGKAIGNVLDKRLRKQAKEPINMELDKDNLPSRGVQDVITTIGEISKANDRVRHRSCKKRIQATEQISKDIKEDKLLSGGVEEHNISTNYNTGKANGGVLDTGPKFVVHVMRSEEVRIAREKLPIIMMEQEIMEAIDESPVTIICGETGCGKTTQVPQFLYEAGFSSRGCRDRSGMIGVTQPRRVAVLATAKRISYEMNLHLGQEVGFQVRHDRKVGSNTRIKFMTDGILLRELQSDFLLRKYSVIVLDEAHERSLNTDILIGMLSRVLPLRQKIYEVQSRAGKASIHPLKIVIMSATLLVDEFVSNSRLFASPPPMIEVPARQFPVTVHFSAKTELVDYVGKAYKKVCAIHRQLPPGGVLVFLTGQAEVNYLCKRLQKAFPRQEVRKKDEKQVNDGDIDMKAISEAADVAEDEFHDELEMVGSLEESELAIESDSEGDLEFPEIESMSGEKPESAGDSEWKVGDSIRLESIKDAFDAVTGSEKRDGPERPMIEKQASVKDVGPLYVLPLYALLPAASQLKIFGAVPEGSRLVVVATNVAETSITIPGIRYVVDCGRVKEKVFERASGIARYEVGWISKASAAQRAGRSGRTGPGHCYRLYSSAIFNDTFPDFPRPEIYRAPIEGLVILLKSMNIVKVSRFPFLSEPDRFALAEAEKCLHALSALDSNTGLLTPLGQEIALYPISPRHSRMLLTAMDIGCSNGIKETCILLAYAGATVAALSLHSPFMTNVAIPEDQEAQNLQLGDIDVKSARNKAKSESKGKRDNADSDNVSVADFAKSTIKKMSQHMKFRHPFSDALSVVKALRAYEVSSDPEEFCRKNNMHGRILYEMSKLRKQLIHIFLVFSKEKGANNIAYSDIATVADVETMWKEEGKIHDLSDKHETVLRQAICAGWADRVARKVSVLEMSKRDEGTEKKRHKGIRYQTCTTEETVYVHPSSSLRKHAPEYVVFNELVRTSRPYMKVLTGVDAHWLVPRANALCTFSKPLSDPPPWYDSLSDDIFCWVSPSFGAHLWQLPLHKCPLKSKKHRIAVFACAFLQGKVLPGMKMLSEHLAADPSIVLVPSGSAQKRASELLHALEVASVDSRCELRRVWDARGDFLFQEILLWMQKSSPLHLESIWAGLKLEAQLAGRTLFGKKRKKQGV